MAGPLVDRGEELERLDGLLDRALEGEGRLCFVHGEGGAGKTTLLQEFCRRAQDRHEDLVVAAGACDAQTGVGDAFLPFREILELLTGDVDSKLAQARITDQNASRIRRVVGYCAEAVIEVGPDLIGAVVPGATFVAAVGMYAASKTPWADKLKRRLDKPDLEAGDKINQNQIFEQYLKVLEKLSEKAPLLLVLDDLQWADTASVALLFRLGRRLEGSRILVVGLYRPSDVALGRGGDRHPLEAVINEMKRYFGDIEVDLTPGPQRGRVFVDSYLDIEANRLGEGFRAALHRRTGGHPLFTGELLRSLQERGDLVRDDGGSWVEGPNLDWAKTPSRVEGVIEERLDRLTDALRRSLTIAAVEGESFTAEVVSRVQPAELRELVSQLSDTLQKRHQLVRALGVERIGDNRLSRYSFSHNLMQSYLLQQLDEVEASFLHEDVGRAIETLHGPASDTAAVQLAHHFDLAGLGSEARHYLTLAGDRAMEVFANQEALSHYSRALTWATEDADRYRLLLSRIKVHELAGDQESRHADLEELDAVVGRSDDPAQRAELALQRARHETAVGNYPAAEAAARQAAELFGATGDVAGEASAHLAAGVVLYQQAKYEAAREECSQGLTQSRECGRLDLEADCLANLGIVTDLSGDRQGARTRFEEALAVYRKADHPTNEARVLSNLGVVTWRSHDLEGAIEFFGQSLTKSRQVGARNVEGIALANLGMVWQSKGDLVRAGRRIEEGLVVNREVGSPYAVARSLGLLASVLLNQGDYGSAEAAEREALEIDRTVGDRQDEAFRLASLGRLARRIGRYDESAGLYEKALTLSKEIGDRDVEAMCLRGRAAMYLDLARPTEALDIAGQAVLAARELGDREGEALAATLVGHAQMALDDLDAAEKTYQQARDLKVSSMDPSTSAGLAHVAVRRADPRAAVELLEPVLLRLLSADTEGMEELFRLYLTAREVLGAAGDARLPELVAAAQDALSRYAARLSDADARRSFLEQVTFNRLLAQA